MAVIAWKGKKVADDVFVSLFPYIEKGSLDERGPVKKAVSWALRNIGKRNLKLNKQAVLLARKIDGTESKSAKWVAKDVLRELTSQKILDRLQ